MAGTRVVYRGSHGRFAGASAGKAERVRAGGFANAAFRARVQSSRVSQKRKSNTKQFNQFLNSQGKQHRAGGPINRAKFVAHNSGLSGKKVAKGLGKAAKSPLGSYVILSAAGAGITAIAGRKSPSTKNGLGQLSNYKGANVRRSLALKAATRTGR